MMRRFAFCLGLLCALAAQAASVPDKLPKPIQTLVDAGYTVGKRFDAGHGLTGWVLSRQGHSTIVYSTADQQVIISGNVIDATGQNLTAQFANQYIPKPDLKPIYDDLAKATFIDERPGDTPRRVIYILFDPNCPYCSVAWQSLRSHVATGIEARWLPVAYLQANSANRAAAILGAKDPVAALATNESGFNAQTHEGGIEPAASVSDAVSQVLKTNDDLLKRLGSSATPTFVWLDSHNEIQIYVGLPPPLKMLEIVGVAVPGTPPPQ